MKKSKIAIKEVFKNKEFNNLLSDYFDGDLEINNIDSLQLDSWGMIIYEFDMDKAGAESVYALEFEKETEAIDMTFKDDSEFTIITVREEKAKLLRWLLKTIGYNKWSDMGGWDPTKYPIYSEYVTMNSDTEADTKKDW